MDINVFLHPIFGDPGRPLRADDCPKTLPGWDSLKHIELVVAIEEAYGIELTTAEIVNLRSVGTIVEVLRQRGVDVSLTD